MWIAELKLGHRGSCEHLLNHSEVNSATAQGACDSKAWIQKWASESLIELF